MFYQPKNLTPPPAKKIIYIAAATLLGVFLSLLLHTLIESLYLDWALQHGATITWYSVFNQGQCALPPSAQYGLLILGAIGGFFLGRLWWRLLYVDKIWQKR